MYRLSKCVVSYQYDTTGHMCLVNDTTQHDTKRHKKLELIKILKKTYKKSRAAGTRTHDIGSVPL